MCKGISNYLKLLKDIPNPLEYPTWNTIILSILNNYFSIYNPELSVINELSCNHIETSYLKHLLSKVGGLI